MRRIPLLLLTLLTLLVLSPSPATADETITVTDVLLREVETAGLRARAIDPIERAICAGRWTPPRAGEPDRDGVVWQPASADPPGWIRDDRLRRAYAHATVTVDEPGVWLLEAMGYRGVYVDGELRTGNVYGYTDDWQPWQPAFDWARIPVRLAAGENELLFFGSRYGLMRARLVPVSAPLLLNADDVTRPDLVVGETVDTQAAIAVINATDRVITTATLVAALDGEEPVRVDVPVLPPYGVRKVGFAIAGTARDTVGTCEVALDLRLDGQAVDHAAVTLDVKQPHENRRVTFRSRIDGSVQYYGYLPPLAGPRPHAYEHGLVLSLHGAAVEAINQSGSHAPLTWAHVVAPTNRRPFGFNWEDWGRLDALEVLGLAWSEYDTDPDRTYLTGHSMGGHGSWHLATLYPDRFAAVGPSAGWVSFWSYRPDREPVDPSPLATMLERATLPSRTREFAPNLASMGVYVLHGLDDEVVSVEEARLMRRTLAPFHRDVDWHEQPGAGHWWDLSDAPGADCVAWAPMFDFFARHRRPWGHERRHAAFRTPNPAISAGTGGVFIAQQRRPFVTSSLDVAEDPARHRLDVTTGNVSVFHLDRPHVDLVVVDGDTLRTGEHAGGTIYFHRDDGWKIGRPAGLADQRHGARGGGFREAFGRHVQLVYGTRGTPAETAWALARARHDAEHLWYQGNASLDVIPDTAFEPGAEPDRNVILYGNADTHEDWPDLWTGDDLRVGSDALVIGDRELRGEGLGLLAVRPRPGSQLASVGIVAGTGLPGLLLTDRRPFLAPGVAYPDVTVFEDLGDGTVVRAAGFFSNAWTVAGGEFVWVDR
ncbi:prolyl oligopeptidase family serine peptidase [bacterium]|nr:prolyl oligopeptidase family serine peptidase [bacterium]